MDYLMFLKLKKWNCSEKKHMNHLVLCINFHLYKKQKYKLL